MSEIKEILEDVKRHIDYLDTTNQSSIRDNEMRVMYYEIERLKADLHEANDSVTWWQNRFNSEHKEIKRLKEEYMILQNASDEREDELQQRIDKALEYINWVWNNTNKPTNTIVALRTLENILQGSE